MEGFLFFYLLKGESVCKKKKRIFLFGGGGGGGLKLSLRHRRHHVPSERPYSKGHVPAHLSIISSLRATLPHRIYPMATNMSSFCMVGILIKLFWWVVMVLKWRFS